MKRLLLVVAAILCFAAISSAQDAWLDTGVGAINGYGNILAIARLDEGTNYAFSWDNSSQSMLCILLDNEGNLNSNNPFGCPYLFLDVYTSRIDVYCAWPGTGWQLRARVSR